MHLRRNRRRLHRLLPFPEGIQRFSGHTDHISRKDRPDTGKQTSSMVGRYHHCNKKIKGTTQKRIDRSTIPTRKCLL